MQWTRRNLIRPQDVEPSCPGWEVVGTFNPGAMRHADRVDLLVRVAEQPRPDANGRIGLPRFDEQGQPHVDWFERAELQWIDARVVIVKATGQARLTSASHLRHFQVPLERILEPTAYREQSPRFLPMHATESMGVEDPRLTRIDQRVFITYVAVSRHGACTALASTEDFKEYQRHGIIFPCENKDVVLFPQRIGGRYAALHRPVSRMPFGTPEMWIAFSDDLRQWGGHAPLHAGGQSWESGRVGGGTPPVLTAEGWLEVFHGNQRPSPVDRIGEYAAGAMLLDEHDPRLVKSVLPQPILRPQEPFEREGFVPGVVFPTAWIDVGEQVALYYGAADTSTAVAVIDRAVLMSLFS